jgi:TATA-box binding protein (TBP) (component of TFIID and TFIIIB)
MPKSNKRKSVSSVASGVKVKNVVSHSKLGCKIDLTKAAIALHGRYDPDVFPACVCRCRQTNTTLSVFDSGKLVVVGALDEDTALIAAHMYALAVRRELNLHVSVFNFVINNVVGSFELGFGLNLDLFLDDHGLDAQWDPENFLGLSYKPYGTTKGVFCFVLFETGNGIITGGKSVSEMKRVYDAYVNDFHQYKRGCEYREQDESTKRSRESKGVIIASTKKQSKKQKKQKELTRPISSSVLL